MERRVFGLTEEEISCQSKDNYSVDPEHKMSPINPDDVFLEPCIRGGEKILDNPEKKEMFKRIYRGKKKAFVERLTDEQINAYLENDFPKNERYVFSYNRYETYIYVSVDENNGDASFSFTLEEFDARGSVLPGKWLKYLYKVFGEEYKRAYLSECAKVFE